MGKLWSPVSRVPAHDLAVRLPMSGASASPVPCVQQGLAWHTSACCWRHSGVELKWGLEPWLEPLALGGFWSGQSSGFLQQLVKEPLLHAPAG